jgi:hypothetical protein
MYFREHGMDFREADRRYADLKRQLDAGSISAKEFDAQRLRLMVKDDEGRCTIGRGGGPPAVRRLVAGPYRQRRRALTGRRERKGERRRALCG